MFELRRDPIVGRQVFIAEDRASRPNDFLERDSADSADQSPADCPFCAGHEEQTPEAELEVSAATSSWQVRVVPNKFPALSLNQQAFAPQDTSSLESVPQMPLGAHEVIIETPRHVQDITELSPDEVARVLRVYRQRLRDWSEHDSIRYVSIFKNVGVAAGASLEHAHSQLIALPDVPPAIIAELGSAEYYFAKHRKCIFCQVLTEELSHGKRLVFENESFVAFCAYAGRQPYETWIVPRDHNAQFEHLTNEESLQLAAVIQRLVRSLRSRLSRLSYNLMLHTSPFRQDAADYYHWHFELVPRCTQLAGFEWGTGMFINPLSPERAAAALVASAQ